MQNKSQRVVVIGTGGTIAGAAADAHDNIGYRAGQLGVEALLANLPVMSNVSLESEQLVQIDSKNITAQVWQRLARRVDEHLKRDDVAGIVVTHGTDTLEETAWFLQRVLAPMRPVVLTAAMRPATSLLADGPQNLADALTVATQPEARGVVAVIGGRVFGAADVRKHHSYRLDAFDGGDAGAVALIEEGRLRGLRAWPGGSALGIDRVARDVATWPWVEIVVSHGGARGTAIDALVAAGVQGLVVAGTGNGSVHDEVAAALRRAEARGVVVRLASRCPAGPVFEHDGWTGCGALGPYKGRVELMLELLA